jgi:hypothetical protein
MVPEENKKEKLRKGKRDRDELRSKTYSIY